MKTRIMLFCCMAAALLLACSNDKSDGEGREPGVETELNGTQLGEGTTLYGLVTDTSWWCRTATTAWRPTPTASIR